jgi:Dopey, N-terminal
LRTDCHTFAKVIKPDDAITLVDAAIAVVLRRDLSLNRRLYSWLLGSEEEDQNAYLMTHSLDLVRMALIQKLQLIASAGEEELASIDTQEPYRVFISLLDKWEIGQPLSNVAVLDIFSSLQKAKMGGKSNEADTLGTTAKMLFEVVDPFATYRQFFFALKHELDPELNAANQMNTTTRTVEVEKDSAIHLLAFVLNSFPVHDEETRRVHLPAIFSGIVHLLCRLVQRDSIPPTIDLEAALRLAQQVLSIIPVKVFARVDDDDASVDGSSLLAAQGKFIEQVELFYAPREPSAEESSRLFLSLQRQDVASALLQVCGRLAEESLVQPRLQTVSALALSLLRDLLKAFGKSESADVSAITGLKEGTQPKVYFDVSTWSRTAFKTLQSVSVNALTGPFPSDLDHSLQAEHSEQIEAICDCILSCATCSALAEPLQLHSKDEVDLLIAKVRGPRHRRMCGRKPAYLQPVQMLALMTRPSALTHAVNLVVETDAVTPSNLVEASLCGQLTQSKFEARLRASDQFGLLWKCVGESEHLTICRRTLMLMALGLASLHVIDRRAQ